MSQYIALTDQNEVEIENAVIRGELVAWRHDGERQWYASPPTIRGIAPEPEIAGLGEIAIDDDAQIEADAEFIGLTDAEAERLEALEAEAAAIEAAEIEAEADERIAAACERLNEVQADE